MPHRQHVMQFLELTLDLFQPRLIGDEQQHRARAAIANGGAHDGLQIERATRKQTGDVRHRTRMITHPQLDDSASSRVTKIRVSGI